MEDVFADARGIESKWGMDAVGLEALSHTLVVIVQKQGFILRYANGLKNSISVEKSPIPRCYYGRVFGRIF